MKVRHPPRHKARELVLQALYAADCGSSDLEESIKQLSSEKALADKHQAFSMQLLKLSRENTEWADQHITSLAKNWDLERINRIDRNILRMAMVELKYMPDVPVKVVINEAIELAKTFSTSKSSGFVNGILDSFIKKLAP